METARNRKGETVPQCNLKNSRPFRTFFYKYQSPKKKPQGDLQQKTQGVGVNWIFQLQILENMSLRGQI